MRFTRRRSDRPAPARSRPGSSLEALEGRVLLSADSYRHFFQYTPSDLQVTNPITGFPVPYSVQHQLAGITTPDNPLLNNQGKVVSGKDRAGDEWTITVHGPGYVIVTDTTPNDGVLADDIDTIQLVGTDINRTYVTGNVVTSFRVQTDSTIPFNRLVSATGVNSIKLNGFTLAQTVAPVNGGPNNLHTGIYLPGGVRDLEFHNIEAPIDLATADAPISIIIGDPSTPLTRVQPVIKLDHVFNTVFNSTSTTVPANVPVTVPTVRILVNGTLRGLDMISTSQSTIDAAQQYRFPVVGTTGRTAVQAQAIDTLNVRDGATNLTASREAVPFQNGFSGLRRLNRARFGGPTDAVGLDVNGPIHSLTYARGMGNPAGSFVGQTADGAAVPATGYGLPAAEVGYASLGYLGGQVTSTDIRKVNIGPADVQYQIPTNPDFVQLYRQGNTAIYPRPGTAMINSLIVSSGNIGRVRVVGDQVNSEIKSGFHYPSFAAGLEGTRAASRIGPVHQTGNLVNGVTSATYRPFKHIYGTPLDTAGPGSIRGNFRGDVIATGGITPLTNVGSGFYARTKSGGYLPPPLAPKVVGGHILRGKS